MGSDAVSRASREGTGELQSVSLAIEALIGSRQQPLRAFPREGGRPPRSDTSTLTRSGKTSTIRRIGSGDALASSLQLLRIRTAEELHPPAPSASSRADLPLE